jgi:hypothetical protein
MAGPDEVEQLVPAHFGIRRYLSAHPDHYAMHRPRTAASGSSICRPAAGWTRDFITVLAPTAKS